MAQEVTLPSFRMISRRMCVPSCSLLRTQLLRFDHVRLSLSWFFSATVCDNFQINSWSIQYFHCLLSTWGVIVNTCFRFSWTESFAAPVPSRGAQAINSMLDMYAWSENSDRRSRWLLCKLFRPLCPLHPYGRSPCPAYPVPRSAERLVRVVAVQLSVRVLVFCVLRHSSSPTSSAQSFCRSWEVSGLRQRVLLNPSRIYEIVRCSESF